MVKIVVNAKQLPIKAHYFFFMAAMGPILPFLPVYGKQLGVSPFVMGIITAVLPLLFFLAKPSFGFIVDRYRTHRRAIFIALLASTSACYVLMYFLPALPVLPAQRASANSSFSEIDTPVAENNCVYKSMAFWGFVLLMSLGNIGFNVSNCISDAICFDVLGTGGEMSYGRQRVWGSVGFGLTAFMAGYAMDWWSRADTVKSYTPAFILISVFTCIDLLCCSKLELPKMTSPESILKDVLGLLKVKPVAIFIFFATIVGIVDSFIIYFLFWYIEDLAMISGHMDDIKMIEGLTVFAETLGGEVLFFTLSGKILKKIGYGCSFIFCFACYALRLGLISLAPNPWWIVLSEFFMQGPSYALCYTTIVAYASVVAPSGTSATVQGIVAGMDDGLGFAIGSLIGGLLYKQFGGIFTLKIYSGLALVTSIAYTIIHLAYLRRVMPETDTRKNIEWKSPNEAVISCDGPDEKQ
ncbi:major facilitator superfamily domain-containing protein 6-B [Copidosoma floridanum]|uniref:major facilitator superfamily domain-containing protein 6-B n=1 Tax=Copidosoma floridanum TaxID=29053 RepID=UPI0006C98AC5|nr:major facilitator superfamily domain-containing protein 6-B [Copidosoma floridanum]XP_014208101.1 major facilitator superfamily domain-containing protein 6-B [Copidosoma floridanum]XP_014208102.1 major facilitator superfamily domain-containing protein 6-B [Copidosoma floridanum]